MYQGKERIILDNLISYTSPQVHIVVGFGGRP